VSNGGYARRQEECQEAKNLAAAARTEYESYERGQPSLREAIKTAEKKTQDAKKQLDIKIQDINQADGRLRELTRENAQARSGFPDNMPALLRAIQQERSFTARPVGPIGHHVTLLKPKWASIIESTLGHSLSSFVVKSHGDQKILSNLMKRVGW
jgi:ATP-dependent RNA helicase DDX6/DHH1